VELNEGFADLGLSEPLLAAVAATGYETPTPIQEKAIPLVLRGVDLLGCAQTGTGKTASYALPIIDILSSGTGKPRMPRCLILAPTRELAETFAGPVTIESYTVMFGANGPTAGLAACRLDDGRRAWGNTRDADMLAIMTREEFCGRPARLTAPGALEF